MQLIQGCLMSEYRNSVFIFLDGDTERRQLIDALKKTRLEVISIAERVPPDQWYEPRYHGMSLGAMLGHLNLMDNLFMLVIRASMSGIRLHLSGRMLGRIYQFTARVFRRRIVTASIRSAMKNEARIAELIQTVPIDQFTREIYSPMHDKKLLLEQALQAFFLHYWQAHLIAMRQAHNDHEIASSDKREAE